MTNTYSSTTKRVVIEFHDIPEYERLVERAKRWAAAVGIPQNRAFNPYVRYKLLSAGEVNQPAIEAQPE